MKTLLPVILAVAIVGGLSYLILTQSPPVRPPAATAPTPRATGTPAAPPPAEPLIAAAVSPQPAPVATPASAPAPEPLPPAVSPDDESTVIHVSAAAGPGGDGSQALPFQTIEEARDAARRISDQPVTVLVGEGHYVLRNGLLFTHLDSGAAGRRVLYRAAPGGKARISSGIVVPDSLLREVTDQGLLERLPADSRGMVRALSLEEAGLEVQRPRNNFRGLELLEIFWNGERMPLARWPGNGKYSLIETVLDNGITAGSTGTFVFRGDEPLRWQQAVEDGLWVRGFWRVPWVIEAVRVGSIDPGTRSITLAAPVSNGIGSKYHRAAGNGAGPGSGEEPWEAINLIEAMDSPGEWAVRFADNSLYLFPPAPSGELLVTDNREPVVKLDGVSHFSFEGFEVDSGLGDGVRIEGGEDVLIAGCRVSNVSKNAIVVNGGTRHTVLSNTTSQTGFSGIVFRGGDRASLAPGGHRILNNIVSHAGLFFPAPGIDGGLGTKSESVGNLVAHNRIHDSANSGIVYSGNDNVFEFNDIYRIGLGSSDLGSFYTTGGWTSRGNIVRNNMVHHSMNANAFYVDDGDCGDTFLGNIAYKTESGGFIGGGHDQIFRHNIFVECTRAMHVDARGLARGYTATDRRLRDDLDSVPYQAPPWSEKYPSLVGILEISPERPSGILIEENLIVACGTELRKSNSSSDLQGVTYENNVVSEDPGIFVNPQELDFTIKPDAPVLAELPGFPRVPFEKIGLYPDAYRPVVPPRDMELLSTGSTERGFDSQTDVDASNKTGKP